MGSGEISTLVRPDASSHYTNLHACAGLAPAFRLVHSEGTSTRALASALPLESADFVKVCSVRFGKRRDLGTGQFKLIIGVERSSDLTTFLPVPMADPETSINAQGKLEFLFTVPGNTAFFKVQNN